MFLCHRENDKSLIQNRQKMKCTNEIEGKKNDNRKTNSYRQQFIYTFFYFSSVVCFLVITHMRVTTMNFHFFFLFILFLYHLLLHDILYRVLV